MEYNEYSISINGNVINGLNSRKRKTTPRGEIANTAAGILRVDRPTNQVNRKLTLSTIPLIESEISSLLNLLDNILLGVVSVNSTFDSAAKNYIIDDYEVTTEVKNSYFKNGVGHNNTQKLVINLTARGD